MENTKVKLTKDSESLRKKWHILHSERKNNKE